MQKYITIYYQLSTLMAFPAATVKSFESNMRNIR
jgi:hypothetical protein